MSDELNLLRTRIATAGRILANEGAATGNFGHVSARQNHGETVLITARGREAEALQFATVNDIIEVDSSGNVVSGIAGLAPPSETAIHLSIYAARSDVQSVVHVHPQVVVALSASGHVLQPLYGAYDPLGVAMVDDGIPIYPRSILISSPELGDELATVLGQHSVCMLHGHGIVAVGRSVEEATTFALALTELAQVNWLALSAGSRHPISHDDRAAFAAVRDRPSANVSAATGSKQQMPLRRADGDTAQWHYLRQRLPR